MNKKFLSIILLVNAVPLMAMESDDNDKQLTTDMATLEMNKDRVDAWDALGKDKKKEVKSTLEKWANKYNAHQKEHDAEKVLDDEQFKSVVKQSYLSIKRSIGEGDTTLPINPIEAEEKKYYYEDFMKIEIQAVRYPGAVCSFGLKTETISDFEKEMYE